MRAQLEESRADVVGVALLDEVLLLLQRPQVVVNRAGRLVQSLGYLRDARPVEFPQEVDEFERDFDRVDRDVLRHSWL